MLRFTGAHRRCGFNGAESRYFGEIMHFLLTIHPQLLHQLEGIHVSAGTAGSDLSFLKHSTDTARKEKSQSLVFML